MYSPYSIGGGRILIDESTTKKIIENYKSRPRAFNERQISIIKRHAQHYRIPFAEDEQTWMDHVGGVVKQAVAGYVSGFTTINIGSPPQTPAEGIARATGSLAGFIGLLPGAPIEALGKAKNLPSIASFGAGLRKAGGNSVPLLIANSMMKKGQSIFDAATSKYAANGGKAVTSAIEFLKNPATSNYITRGLRMGIASGVSSWQGGIDQMLKSFVWGTAAASIDATIGNAIRLNDKVANMAVKGLAGSMADGLPATLQGYTTPEQIYYYLRGAYFGATEVPWTQRYSQQKLVEWTKSGKDPATFADSVNMPKIVRDDFIDQASKFIVSPAGQLAFFNEFKDKYAKSYAEEISKHHEAVNAARATNEKVDPTKADIAANDRWDGIGQIEMPHKIVASMVRQDLRKLIVGPNGKPNFETETKLLGEMAAWHKLASEEQAKAPDHRNRFTTVFLSKIKANYGDIFKDDKVPIEITRKIQKLARAAENTMETSYFVFSVDNVDPNKPSPFIHFTYGSHNKAPNGKVLLEKRSRIALDDVVPVNKPPRLVDSIYNGNREKKYWRELGYIESLNTNRPLYDETPAQAKLRQEQAIMLTRRTWNQFRYYYYGGNNAKSAAIFMPIHELVEPAIKSEASLDAMMNTFIAAMQKSKLYNKSNKSVAEIRAIIEDEFAKDKIYDKKQGKAIWLSNVLYEANLQWGTIKDPNDISKYFEQFATEDLDIVNNAKKWTKRNQLFTSSGTRMSKQFLLEPFFIDPLNKIKYNNFDAARTLIIDDPSGTYANTPARTDASEHVGSLDGASIPMPELIIAAERSMGWPDGGGELKIATTTMPTEFGTFLQKTAWHNAAPQEIYDILKEHGIMQITFKSAAKQSGKYKSITLDELLGNSPKIDEAVFDVPWESIRINPGKHFDEHKAFGKNTFTRQVFGNMMDAAFTGEDANMIAQARSEFLGMLRKNNFEGDKLANKLVERFLSSNNESQRAILRKEVIDNLDHVGKKYIKKLIMDTKDGHIAKELIERIMSINEMSLDDGYRDVDSEISDAEYNQLREELAKNSTDLEYYFSLMQDNPHLALALPNVRSIVDGAIKNFFINSLRQPKIDNSADLTFAPYVAKFWKNHKVMSKLNDNPDMFMLGDGAKEGFMLTQKNGKKISLGKLWDRVQKMGEHATAEDLELLRMVAVRTPQGSPSGARVLTFGGFDGNPGYRIYFHPDVAMHLGGGDYDIDSAKLYAGNAEIGEAGNITGGGITIKMKDAIDKFKDYAYTKPQQPVRQASSINFTTSNETGYPQRTKDNAAGADATIDFATDFTSYGEKLTKSATLRAGKKYIPIDLNNLDIPKYVADIVSQLKASGSKSLNIAGNGLYTFRGKYTQERIDNIIYDIIRAVHEQYPIASIRSGGQTGVDEAGAKAGARLGIPTTVHAPANWMMRDGANKNWADDEGAFKKRFEGVNKQQLTPATTKQTKQIVRSSDDKYYATDVSGGQREVVGSPVLKKEFPDYDLFITRTRDGKNWQILTGTGGVRISVARLQKEAKEAAIELLNKSLAKDPDKVKKAIFNPKFLTPRYTTSSVAEPATKQQPVQQQAKKVTVRDYDRYGDVPKGDANIIYSMRTKASHHLGNPFTGTDRGSFDVIRMDSIKSSVDSYIKWLEDPSAEFVDADGNKHKNIEPKRRQWILDQIDKGNFDGKTIGYYKDRGRFGEYRSHADALADFINQRRQQPEQRNGELYNIDPKNAVDRNGEKFSKRYESGTSSKADMYSDPLRMFNRTVRESVQIDFVSGRNHIAEIANGKLILNEATTFLRNKPNQTHVEKVPWGEHVITVRYKLKGIDDINEAINASSAALNMAADVTEFNGLKSAQEILYDFLSTAVDIKLSAPSGVKLDAEQKQMIKTRMGLFGNLSKLKSALFSKNFKTDRMYTEDERLAMLKHFGSMYEDSDPNGTLLSMLTDTLHDAEAFIPAITNDNYKNVAMAYESVAGRKVGGYSAVRMPNFSIKPNRFQGLFFEYKMWDRGERQKAIDDITKRFWHPDVLKTVMRSQGKRIFVTDKEAMDYWSKYTMDKYGTENPEYINKQVERNRDRLNSFINNPYYRSLIMSEQYRVSEKYTLEDLYAINAANMLEKYRKKVDKKTLLPKHVVEKVQGLLRQRDELRAVIDTGEISMRDVNLTLDDMYLKIRSSLKTKEEQDFLDVVILSPFTQGTKGTKSGIIGEQARREADNVLVYDYSTDRSRLPMELRSMNPEIIKEFYSEYDKLLNPIDVVSEKTAKGALEALKTEDIVNRFNLNPNLFRKASGDLFKVDQINDELVRDEIEKIIPFERDKNLRRRVKADPVLYRKYETEYLPAFRTLKANLVKARGENADLQDLNKLVRGLTGKAFDTIGKDLTALSLEDVNMLNRYFDYVNRPSLLNKLFGGKEVDNPSIKWLYYHLFPSEIHRDELRFSFQTQDVKGWWVNKYGAAFEGTVSIPMGGMGKLAEILNSADEFTAKATERYETEFKRAILPYRSLENGDRLEFIAIVLHETPGMIEGIKKSTEIPELVKQEKIEALSNRYKAAISELNMIHRKTPVLNIKTKGENDEDIIQEISPKQVVKQISKIMTENNDHAYDELIAAKMDNVLKYAIKDKAGDIRYHYNFSSEESSRIPMIDAKRFFNDMQLAAQEQRDWPNIFGLDGVKLIAHSIAYNTRFPDSRRGEMGMDLIDASAQALKIAEAGSMPTGRIQAGYFPHMNFDESIYKKDVGRDIEAIRNDPHMTDESKDTQIKKKVKDYLVRGGNINLELDTDAYLRSSELEQAEYNRLMAEADNINDVKLKLQMQREASENRIKYLRGVNVAGNQMSREMFSEGYDISLDAYPAYFNKILKTYYSNMSQTLARLQIGETTKQFYKLFDDKTARTWNTFMHLYAQGSAGYGIVIPDAVANDPDMHMGKTLYKAYADSEVIKKVNRFAAKLGIRQDKINMFGEAFSINDLQSWSAAEAKYSLATLLARPKSMTANMFGGTINTGIYAGFDNLRKAWKVDEFQKIHRDWTSIERVRESVIKWGVIEDMLVHELDMSKYGKNKQLRNFVTDAARRISKDPEMSDKTLLRLAKEHGISERLFNSAAWFMRTAERRLRSDAFLASYLQAVSNFTPLFAGGGEHNVLKYDSPLLIEIAKKGVKATQFLYSAPFRPMFSTSALGKVMTRFQMYAYNSVDFRRNVANDAAVYGFREGTKEFDRFKRFIVADMLMMAASTAFAYSLFDNNLPAPWNWVQDFANWLFGDEKERDRAFYGVYPKPIAPIQMFTPPSMRMVGPTINGMIENDFSKVANYTLWTMFPFGPLAMDIKRSIDSPSQIIDKMTGIPTRAIGEMLKTRSNIRTGETWKRTDKKKAEEEKPKKPKINNAFMQMVPVY